MRQVPLPGRSFKNTGSKAIHLQVVFVLSTSGLPPEQGFREIWVKESSFGANIKWCTPPLRSTRLIRSTLGVRTCNAKALGQVGEGGSVGYILGF